MTGSLVVKGVKSHQYKNFKVDEAEWPPKYWKLCLKLEGDVSIAFSDPRRFARIRLQEDPAAHEPISLLGFDPVLSMPSCEFFRAIIKGRTTSLKALLLNQVSSHSIPIHKHKVVNMTADIRIGYVVRTLRALQVMTQPTCRILILYLACLCVRTSGP